MEGLGDRPFRRMMALVGGFDEATTEFLRVPKNAHIPSLSKKYQSDELSPIPLCCQIMGDNPDLIAEMTKAVIDRGAPRVELNCGCPSNTVVGRGAGSSLLKDPEHLNKILTAMVSVATVPVSAKLRSGYEDTSLFEENLCAVQEAGVAFMTLHPRTKREAYKPPAHWDLIARAKQLLQIPVIGNGDILNAQDAMRMLRETNCDGLMIGRGAVANPWIFHEIRSQFEQEQEIFSFEKFENILLAYLSYLYDEALTTKTCINKFKQLSHYFFQRTPSLMERRKEILRQRPETPESFLKDILKALKDEYSSLALA
ncbi:MAG: tRNA-dihydrouridine synthase [Waddliaceae bacterium]|nr:tRNA-dihydrouridine synthase [Waddliaceae bacterium]